MEVTACLEAGRLLLIFDLNIEANDANDQNTYLDTIRNRHHCQPPFLDLGGKKFPPIKRDLRLPILVVPLTGYHKFLNL